MSKRILFMIVTVFTLGGCSELLNSHLSERTKAIHNGELVSSEAERKLILVRQIAAPPGVEGNRTIYCTLPQADSVQNVDMKNLLEVAAHNPQAALKMSGALSQQTNKDVKLRFTPAQSLQSMRDVLYIACEARANGFISEEQYKKYMNFAVHTNIALLMLSQTDSDSDTAKYLLDNIINSQNEVDEEIEKENSIIWKLVQDEEINVVD